MSKLSPFVGLIPPSELAQDICSPPYDVMNKQEARDMVTANPKSYLRVIRPEVNVTAETSSDQLHQIAKDQLDQFIKKGYLVSTNVPCFYLYQIQSGHHIQTGLVAGASVDEYEDNTIKKHELTRPDKEQDRTQHVLTVKAQTGPVFLTYKQRPEIKALFLRELNQAPTLDFTAEDGVTHRLWVLQTPDTIAEIQALFERVPSLYVADGHHRSAAAANARRVIDSNGHSHEYREYTHFLSVIFPSEELAIMDYNRVVKDLNGLTEEAILARIDEFFTISKPSGNFETVQPQSSIEFAMFLGQQWYKLTFKPSVSSFNVVDRLAVSILQQHVLHPILGIEDPRTDSRVGFVGGIRGHEGLEARCHTDAKIAFRLFPTSINELIDIADHGELMPPKSTWFEPKLRSGVITKPIA